MKKFLFVLVLLTWAFITFIFLVSSVRPYFFSLPPPAVNAPSSAAFYVACVWVIFTCITSFFIIRYLKSKLLKNH